LAPPWGLPMKSEEERRRGGEEERRRKVYSKLTQ
jgi:hypothetical protein